MLVISRRPNETIVLPETGVTVRVTEVKRGTVRLGLLDVFETQQHLVFRQRFRPAAKPMPLQLLDDLTQPFVLHSLGEQHRFQRFRIIRQCVARHHQIRSYSAELCDDRRGLLIHLTAG